MRFLLIGEEGKPVGGIAVDEDGLPDGELDDAKQRVEHVVDDLAQFVPPGFFRQSVDRASWVGGCLPVWNERAVRPAKMVKDPVPKSKVTKGDDKIDEEPVNRNLNAISFKPQRGLLPVKDPVQVFKALG